MRTANLVRLIDLVFVSGPHKSIKDKLNALSVQLFWIQTTFKCAAVFSNSKTLAQLGFYAAKFEQSEENFKLNVL